MMTVIIKDPGIMTARTVAAISRDVGVGANRSHSKHCAGSKVMTTSACIMDLSICRVNINTGSGTGSRGMTTLATRGSSGYSSGVIGVGVIGKVYIMTVVTVTGTDIKRAARSNYSKEATISDVMT